MIRVNKRGVTILELLISMTIISIVVLLLVRVLFSLNSINNDTSYASNDEITRTEIIKNIESDFLKLNLIGLDIKENPESTILIFNYLDSTKELIINESNLKYDNITYNLTSTNATYSKCLEYSYTLLDDNYYLLKINIPVLIEKENTTINDDITLTYLSLLNEDTNIPSTYICSK